MGILLILMTIGGLLVAALMVAFGVATKKYWLTKFAVGGIAIWFFVYGVLLLGFSLFSSEKTLALNEPKEFCGFYLDCHLHSSVSGIRTAKTIGDQTATGEFYIVSMQVFSDAKSPSIGLRLNAPTAVVFDADKLSYERNEAAEISLPTAKMELGKTIWNSNPIEKEIVFDLPFNVKNPRLDIREGFGIDKVIEAVLVGDEDSFLHKRVYFKLEKQNQTLSDK